MIDSAIASEYRYIAERAASSVPLHGERSRQLLDSLSRSLAQGATTGDTIIDNLIIGYGSKLTPETVDHFYRLDHAIRQAANELVLVTMRHKEVQPGSAPFGIWQHMQLGRIKNANDGLEAPKTSPHELYGEAIIPTTGYYNFGSVYGSRYLSVIRPDGNFAGTDDNFGTHFEAIHLTTMASPYGKDLGNSCNHNFNIDGCNKPALEVLIGTSAVMAAVENDPYLQILYGDKPEYKAVIYSNAEHLMNTPRQKAD